MDDPLDDPFESPKMLVEEAFPAIDDLDVACVEFMKIAEPEKLDYVNEARQLRIVGFRPSKAQPNKPRVRASRIVKDLRDALDQATFQASRALNPKAGNYTYFPFATDPDDFDTLFHPKRGRCRDIPEPIRPFLKTLEPWPTHEGHEGGNDLLRALGYVSGPNKHQVTLQVQPDLAGLQVYSVKATRGQLLELGISKHGRDLEFIRATPDTDGLEYELKGQFFVGFKEPSQFANRAASSVLGDLAGIVQRIVLGVEAETARLLRENGR